MVETTRMVAKMCWVGQVVLWRVGERDQMICWAVKMCWVDC